MLERTMPNGRTDVIKVMGNLWFKDAQPPMVPGPFPISPR